MTDQVWERIRPLLPDANTFGRPRCADRDVLEGIFWVLKTGARWRDLPKQLPVSTRPTAVGKVSAAGPVVRRLPDVTITLHR